MRHRTKLLLAGLTAALALGALVSASSANRIATKNTNTQFRATWNKLQFISSVATIECHVTIEGSFHSRTTSKILESLAGYVTRVTVDSSNCTGGSSRALTETLPWHIRYGGFEGTLPKISGVTLRLVGASLRVQILILSIPVPCLYTSSAASPMKGIVNVNTANGQAESLKVDETADIPKTSGSATSCPSAHSLTGITTALTLEANTTKITLTLVA